MKFARNAWLLPAIGLSAALLAGCITTQPVVGPSQSADQKSAAEANNTLQITDINLPTGTKLDTENTLLMGSNDTWLGRIVLKSELTPIQAFNHFYTGMPSNGWNLVASVQSRISTLTHTRGERVSSIQIEPSPMGGTTVSITVSARQPSRTTK